MLELRRGAWTACSGSLVVAVVLLAAAAWAAEPVSEERPSSETPGAEREHASDDAPAADVEPSAEEGVDSETPSDQEPARESGGAARSDERLGRMTEGVEEIIVTGVRLEDTLQADPVSATTFGGEELRSLRIQNVQDLADYTANFEVNTAFAASNPNLFIRGIGLKDYNANAAGAVAIYQDGVNVVLPALQLGQMYDVASIQVLRGPQGTGRGHDASAGAVYIHSVEPGDELDFNGSFTYGNYNTIQAEGGVTVPLTDWLSARVAFTANFRDGITENACANWNPGAHPEFQEKPNPFFPEDGSVISYLVNQETLLAEYRKDEIANNLPSDLQYEIGATKGGKHNNDDNRRLFQQLHQRQLKLNQYADEIRAEGLEPVAKGLRLDGVCMVEPTGPGGIVLIPHKTNGFAPVGTYFADSTTQFEDLQGLKSYINNVDNWAGRGLLRLTPPPESGLQPFAGTEWLLNVHGLQNRSDSFHQQMLGAEPIETLPSDEAIKPPGFLEWVPAGWSERAAADLTHGVYEGTRRVPGLGPNVNGQLLGEGGSNPFVGWYNQDGRELLDTWGASLKGLWEFGEGITVSSLTGWEWYKRGVADEGDATPLVVYPAQYDDKAYQISQDVRAEGTFDRGSWEAGFYFLYDKSHSLNSFPDVRGFSIDQTWDQELLSGAPYIGATFLLTEQLSLEGGVRYNVESKSFRLQSDSIGVGPGATDSEVIPDQEEERTWNQPTGGVTLVYAPTWSGLERLGSEDLSLYAKYTRGMKGGHFNAGLTVRSGSSEARIEVVKPEYIDAAEVGLKSSWFDGRLTLNLAGFRYWYKDLQVFDIQNGAGEIPFPKLENADARVLGAEVDLEARPLPGLFVQTSFGYLDSSFENFIAEKRLIAGPRAADDVVQTFDYKGNPLISAPEFSLSTYVEQTLPLFGWGYLVPQYSFTYRSKQYLDPQKLDPISQDAYWVHNARLAYRTPDERIEVAGWVQNFLDEPYKIDAFDLTREYKAITEVWSEPRMFGITLSYAW